MKVTDRTRTVLAWRRQKRDLTQRGYEMISCNHGIGNLWQLDRGGRWDWRLVDAVLGLDGKSVYVLARPAEDKGPAGAAVVAAADDAAPLRDALTQAVGWIEECGSDHEGRQAVLIEARMALRQMQVVPDPLIPGK